MTLKKTDLAKQMALKIDGKRKAAQIPDRFGKQSSQPASANASVQTAPKLVPVTCRLPADLVHKLREKALSHPGGIHGLMGEAAQGWLTGAASASSKTNKPDAGKTAAKTEKPAVKKVAKTAAKKVAKKVSS